MELLALLAIGIVVAIPIMAIVALVRSNSAHRRIEESWYKISELRGEIANLRNELAGLSERVARQQSAAEIQASKRDPAPAAVSTAPVVAAQATPAPAPSPMPAQLAHQAVASSQPDRPAPVPPASGIPNVPAPALDLQEIRQKAPAGIAPFQAPARPDEQKDQKPAPITPAQIPPPAPAPPAPVASRPSRPAAPAPPAPPMFASSFSTHEPEKPEDSIFDRLKTNLPLEQFLGMNLFAKIGIVLLVLGLALLGRMAITAMGPGPRVVLSYAIAAGMLGGGIWLERRERYRLLGHTGIGGGWALLFFTTYAMHHVAPMTVMSSNTLDCVLMLIVAVAMVVHTLRYRSQLVTGLAFLLAFSTVALTQDTVYALAAGVILALGIAVIALRMSWFELEVFGIAASYANHFYWLYRLFPNGVAGNPFPHFWPSAIILVLYWAIFRVSYVVRKIASPRHEAISTVAALANTMMLLGVMKFQSTRPDLAFYALLAIGAMEFILGQLPITRRRQAAFALLTVVGTLLVFAAIPFKFTGNNIALFWMIAAEALLVAGIVQKEILFRRLGLLAGCLTGLLVVYEASSIVEVRATSEALFIQDGILLLICSAAFYLNSLYLRGRWQQLFGKFDGGLATAQSHLGCITAFLGVWAIFTGDWTAIAWATLLLGAALGHRRLASTPLLLQSWVLAGAVIVRAAVFNCHFDNPFPHHLAMRLFTLPFLALLFYGTGWALDGRVAPSRWLRSVSLWSAAASLAALFAVELPIEWVAPTWVALALALCLIGRRFRLPDLTFQEHVLAVAAVAALFIENLNAENALDRYLPLIGCAAGFYAISRFCTQIGASHQRPAAWLHTWAATAMLAALAWHESPQPWLAVIWILFALALAIFDRIFTAEELPFQAHMLALLAVARAVTLNFFIVEKWHGIDLRLITVLILVAALYSLARCVRMPASLNHSDAHHVYTWAATGLAAWLLWSELEPNFVAPSLGVFALLLFEIGSWRRQKQLRLQSYLLLAASFLRILLVNLYAARLPGQSVSPAIYTILPLTVIYFYIWQRLQSAQTEPRFGNSFASHLIAYFGAGSVVALLSYQLAPQWVITGWAFVVIAMMAAAFLLDKEVFLEQSALLTAGIVLFGLVVNIFGDGDSGGDFWSARVSSLALTSALLFAALPSALRIRTRYADRPRASLLAYFIGARRPDQFLFFAPLLLIVFTIAVKMNPGMITLAWGIVGLAVIPLGLLARQRSYRLSGLALLVLCIGKIVVHDAWQLGERDRYITFIVLGAMLIIVSALYSKYREQVSRLL